MQFREMIKAGGKYLKKRRLLRTNIFPLTKMGTIPIEINFQRMWDYHTTLSTFFSVTEYSNSSNNHYHFSLYPFTIGLLKKWRALFPNYSLLDKLISLWSWLIHSLHTHVNLVAPLKEHQALPRWNLRVEIKIIMVETRETRKLS